MYIHLINSIYTQVRAGVLLNTGAPTFLNLVVNNLSRGNDTFDLIFTRNLESPGADPSLGWDIEISSDGSTWASLNLTGATVTISDNSVLFKLAGNRTTIDATHQLRTSYSSVTGDIRNPVGNTDLATFGPDTTSGNNSTSDLASNIEDWYKFEEASGATRVAEVNGVAYDLADTNTVGTRTGASGTGLQLDLLGTNYLAKTTIFDPPSDGKFTVSFYHVQDALPSVTAAGDAYLVHRWRTNNTRSWTCVVPEATSAPVQLNTMYFAGHNTSNNGFQQHCKNRGAFTNTTVYCIVAVYDPTVAIPIVVYTQQLNTPGDFTTENDNYNAPSSGDPQCKQTSGSTNLTIGDLPDSGPNAGVNGGIDTLIKWDRALTAVEAAAICEYYGDPPYLPDTV